MRVGMFEGRKILVATNHKKEQVIAPILLHELGLHSFALTNFDTDAFGAFTGEIEREHGPLFALRQKAYSGLNMAGVDLVVASEGSFGPHPTLYFMPADDEILLFCDKENDLEIMAREISTDTNFASTDVQTEEELLDFAHKSRFPSHGLILSEANQKNAQFFKGIVSADMLLYVFYRLKSKADKIHVQTDMRAMYNPTRMRTIAKACEKLVHNIRSTCPQCTTPGYIVADVLDGLSCSLCGRPTKSTLAHKYICKKCHHEEMRYYPVSKFQEDPTFCDYCNP